ncbi:DUF4956 domain-containing protein [[Clostridium] symbiosum]|nr:DUF4956 domain-containing protein [[Clostridium] symbiosum]MBT9787607.1 DUF4956 domain-containing protein [[Clostridium] symbiosum]
MLTPMHLLVSLIFTMCLGGGMFITYRMCHDSLTYNKQFNVMLLMLSFISTLLLALIQNNPLLSLGILGSLSICRVRANTRDPRDLGFVFWALAIGISSAIGAFAAGIMATLLLAVIMLAFSLNIKSKNALTVVVRGDKCQIANVERIMGQARGSAVQCKNIFANTFELVYEMKLGQKDEESILTLLSTMDGIHGVNVLAPETKVA